MTNLIKTSISGRSGAIAVFQREAPHPRGHVLLVHGATYSGPTAFDFALPGEDSLIRSLANRGLSVTTFAIRGYGESDPVDDGYSVTTAAAVEDLTTVADWLAGRGVSKPLVLGWSWGSRISGRWAAANPERVSRLVLYAGALFAGGPPRERPAEGFRVNDEQSVLDRLEPEFTDPALAQALAHHVAQVEPRSPNGVHADLAPGASPSVDPASLTMPTLLIYGAADRLYHAETVASFFAALATDDKALVVIPAAGHFLHLQRPKQRFFETVASFLLA
ncbi:MAG: alpha/beta fold hydrolase [Dehalococcoidia bacterium]